MTLILAILGIAVALFITEWLRADIVAVMVMVSLALTGVLTPEEAFSGFGSNAVMAIAALLVVGQALVRTGIVKKMADGLHRLVGNSRWRLMVVSTLAPGILSGFINIVAAVTIFIPAVRRMARRSGADASHFLMPMALAGLMGANLSLIGASHNLVVDELLRQSTGDGFAFFEFSAMGAALLATAVAYSLLLARPLLGGRSEGGQADERRQPQDLVSAYQLNERLWEVAVSYDSDVAGRRVGEVGIGARHGLSLILIHGDGGDRVVTDADCRVQGGDTLALGGRKKRVDELIRRHKGLTLMGRPDANEAFPWSVFELAEAAVPPRSGAIGKTLRQMGLRRRADLTCVALWRDGQPHRTDARDRELAAGDGLLFFGLREAVRHFDPAPDFVWLRPPRPIQAPSRTRKWAPFAVVVFLLLILAAALDLTSIAVAALAGSAAMVAVGIIRPKAAYEAIQWRTIVLVGGMYPMGMALEKTGAAKAMADLIMTALGGFGPLAALIGVGLMALLLTQPMHNAVAAVIMTPVAMKVAGALSSNPKAFAVAVIVGASASFLMPVGHPAPLLVKEPGGYGAWDYLKFGLGFALVVLGMIALLVPFLWPL